MPESSRELSYSIILDQNGRPFVKQVESTMGDASRAGEKPAAKLGATLGRVITTGTLVRLGTAAFLLRRMGLAATEQSPAVQKLSRDVDVLQGKLGTELQAGFGKLASSMSPAIQAFTNADGSLHGLVLTAGALLLLGPKLNKLLVGLGATNPIIIATFAALAAGGAVVGKLGQQAAEVEARLRKFQEIAAAAPSTAALEEEIELHRQRILELEAETRAQAAKTQAEASDVQMKYRHVQASQLQTNANAKEIADHEQIIAVLQTEIRQREELIDNLNAVTALAGPETSADLINRLNVEIALGKTKLGQARDEVSLREEALKTQLAALKVEGEAESKERALSSLGLLDRFQKAKDSAEQQAILTEARLQTERELLSIQSAYANLGDRITEQQKKQLSEAQHRAQLVAQIADAIAEQGPIEELNLARAQLRAFLEDGHKETEIQVLELKKQIVELEAKQTAFVEQRAQSELELSRAKSQQFEQEKREAEAREQFARAVGISVSRLGAENEAQFRAQRIQDLREELLLENLTNNEILLRAQRINELSQVDEAAAERQKAALNELIGLLQQERDAASQIPPELRLIGQAGEQALQSLTRNFVTAFTRGKKEAQDWGEVVLSVIEDIIARLLVAVLLKSIVSAFSLGTGGGSLIGGPLGDLINPGGGNAARFPGGGLPNFPVPQLAGASSFGGFGRMERAIQEMRADISALRSEGIAITGQGTLSGNDIRFSYKRAESSAGNRKL